MSPRERAAQVYDQYWSDVSKKPASKQDPLPDMRPLLEQAIIAAVAEDRESRECCKAEREAWAMRIEWIASGASGQSKDGYEYLAEMIRARAERDAE